MYILHAHLPQQMSQEWSHDTLSPMYIKRKYHLVYFGVLRYTYKIILYNLKFSWDKFFVVLKCESLYII